MRTRRVGAGVAGWAAWRTADRRPKVSAQRKEWRCMQVKGFGRKKPDRRSGLEGRKEPGTEVGRVILNPPFPFGDSA